MDHANSSFLSGSAAFKDLLFFAKERDEDSDKGIVLTNFFALDGAKWSIFKDTFSWIPIAMATFKPGNGRRVIVGVSPHGQLWECLMTPMEEFTGMLSEDPPALIRNLTVVENVIYAVGMARVVYRRDATNSWTSMGPNAPLPKEGAAGFNDMAAASGTGMYAVGWEGEIWKYDGKRWAAIDSPTSAHLRAVCYAPDGKFYAVGYNGVMIRGRGDKWDLVETGRPETLMDVCAFEEKIYVTTDFEILELTDTGLVPTEAFAVVDDRPATCLHLLVAADGVFSMGPKDLFLYSGGSWRRAV